MYTTFYIAHGYTMYLYKLVQIIVQLMEKKKYFKMHYLVMVVLG